MDTFYPRPAQNAPNLSFFAPTPGPMQFARWKAQATLRRHRSLQGLNRREQSDATLPSSFRNRGRAVDTDITFFDFNRHHRIFRQTVLLPRRKTRFRPAIFRSPTQRRVLTSPAFSVRQRHRGWNSCFPSALAGGTMLPRFLTTTDRPALLCGDEVRQHARIGVR